LFLVCSVSPLIVKDLCGVQLQATATTWGTTASTEYLAHVSTIGEFEILLKDKELQE